MNHYRIPAKETRTEINVVNSRFIATLAPAFTLDEAKAFIARIKSEFSDASHNVPAFAIGHGSSVTAHCNDDGEPFGTAGRPVLAVLQGSGLGDAAVVVTRYFGGTKLGKGGLVRAYGDSVRSVLNHVPLAKKVSTHTVMIAISYSNYNSVSILIDRHHGKILEENFTADVTITSQFVVDVFPEFQEALKELTHGVTTALIISTNKATIMPLNEY